MGIPRLNKETSLFRANAIPDYVAGVVTEAKAAIKVTTDQIALEVSRKVGVSEVISRINQSPESVTIDADRLDIATSTDGGNGVFVHPRNDATTGWRISDVLELLKGGLSYFKVWLDSSVTKVRVGLETAGHTIFSPNGMEVFSDASTNVAEFGASGARIGKANDNHVTIDDDSIDMSHSGVEMAHFGYGEGAASGGTATAPYYTLGRRADATTNVYSSLSTYSVGARVLYDNEEYICIRAITTPEAWTANHWQRSIGNWSVAVGNRVTASGYSSYAEGNGTTAIGGSSHAEGSSTFVSGAGSHAEGSNTSVSGYDSHAEGYRTTVSGDYSHAEGSHTIASGNSSHAEGSHTIASGNSSHAQNYGTVAAYINQTAIGKSNDNQSNHAFEIGNGTDEDHRSNAFAVAWDGAIETANPSGTLDNLGLGVVDGTITNVESGVTISNVSLYRIGRLVVLSAMTSRAQGTGGESAVFTLPDGFRPAEAWRGPVGHTGKGSTTATGNASVYAVINTNGVVAVNSPAAINLVAAAYIIA